MIDPRKPDHSNTPVSPTRPAFGYAPRSRRLPAQPEITFGPAVARRHAHANGPAHSKTATLDAAPLIARNAHHPDDAAPAPLVTITTAFYNTGDVFRDTAKCVFAQSLQAWEWIIVNDGSTDPAALALLDEFRSIDPRVRVIDHPQNKGLSAARNTGFRNARTNYLYQLDSDDLIEPTALEKCLWYIHTHPNSAFVTSYVVGFGAQQYLWEKGLAAGEQFLADNLTTPMGIIRRDIFEEVGGYDESNRGGMEDWDFWLNCAAHGYWGETLAEFLAWYRRRDQHWDSWANMRAEERRREFHEGLIEKYESRLKGKFPHIPRRWPLAFEPVRVEPGIANPLAKTAPRLLVIVPWLTLGGADKFNVAMIRELAARGWEITVATTLAGDNSWLPEFTALTPDVFVTPHFLDRTDVPAFLRYLIDSRQPDAVMVTNSEMGYHLLPFLRAHCPDPAYIDLSHMEEPWWKNGGHPRYGAASQPILDLNIVVSEHLKNWQVQQGASPERIEVCYVSACESSEHWKRSDDERRAVRDGLAIRADQPVILYAGRIVEQKRPRIFARVMQALAAADLDFTCLVAGDGPDMPWLRHFVHEHHLASRVRLLGAVPHSGMHELMSASDIFFLPSMWEGIAISIYEAMSMELAVVGADVGGQRELVTPPCGILVPRRDEEDELRDYTDALAALLSDPARRAAMGASARRRVRDGFEPAHMGERIVDLIALAQRWRDESPRLPIDPLASIELAVRGLEYLRSCDVADHLCHERNHLVSERDTLRRERDALLHQRDQLAREHRDMQLELLAASRAASTSHLPDPTVLARRMIEENVRYVAVDRLNNALKAIRLQRALKAATIKLFRANQRIR